jgi:hypothetical protein
LLRARRNSDVEIQRRATHLVEMIIPPLREKAIRFIGKEAWMIYTPVRGKLESFDTILFTASTPSQQALSALLWIEELEVLDLSEATIRDADLVHLYPLVNLRELRLKDKAVSDAVIAKLQKVLPNLRIVHVH